MVSGKVIFDSLYRLVFSDIFHLFLCSKELVSGALFIDTFIGGYREA